MELLPETREAALERGLRVLIVDDSRHFLASAKAFFETLPRIARVETAPSGEAALALLARATYDLMVLDLSMAGIGGLEVARRVRELEDAPKIVMVTLYDEPEFRQAARSVGADEFMHKPDLAGDVDSLLERLFGEA